jgi:PadR family transcriptional regulator
MNLHNGDNMTDTQQLRKGSTPLLILSVLAHENMYGYQIMRELERRSEGYFSMTAALLYPALHQLEADGLLGSEWQAGQGKRRRKYYSITTKGRRALAERQAEWENFIENLRRTIRPSLHSLVELGR